MDEITHTVRLEQWKKIIEQCNSRPEGMSAKQWLFENNISDKKYYYWQRQIRQEAYQQMKFSLSQPPATQQPAMPVIRSENTPPGSDSTPGVTFLELPVPEPPVTREISDTPDAVIQTSRATISLYNSVSDSLLNRILEVVSNAG